MRRLLAALVAAGLIVGAVFVRNTIDDTPDADGRSNVVRVSCAIELRGACDGLGARYQVTFEDAAATADRLTGGQVDLDLWVAPEPWPAMVDDARNRAGMPSLFEATAPVARSALVAVAPDSVGDCDWRCIASGDARLGTRGLRSGIGALELGAAAAAYFGSASFAANDFDGAFRSWVTGFADAVEVSDEPVTRLLQSRAFFEIALSFEAEAAAVLDAASEDRRAGLRLLYPAPVAFVDVVVADAAGLLDGRARDLPASLEAALVDAGWQAPAGEPNGLPRAGVLVALRDEVR